MSQPDFSGIRSIYRDSDITEYTPYMFDWISIFTPIERAAWGAIRNLGLPFLPQYPIGPFFADFADPVTKLVIECDGAKFHTDKERDRRRDEFMRDLGWSVYRVPGSDCARVLDSPGEVIDEFGWDWKESAKAINAIRTWYLRTVDGFIAAIAERHYFIRMGYANELTGLLGDCLIDEVLKNRRSV